MAHDSLMEVRKLESIYRLGLVLAIAVLVSITIASVQSVDTSTTIAAGQIAGKAKGHSDAMNGYPADASCGSGHTNDYCAAYKLAYNIEYYWTKLVQDPR